MKKLLTLSAFVVVASSSFAVFFETEPNDTYLTPNVFSGVVAGDIVSGTTTGSSSTTAGSASADYFRLNMAAQAQGIYKTQIALTSATLAHSGVLVGRSTLNATTSATIQSSGTLTTPARMNQWYSFGSAETINYKVTGLATTTAAYEARISQTLITPTNLGTTTAGLHTFDLTSTLDTEIYVMDLAGNVISMGDDDLATSSSSTAATLIAGQSYYIAVGRYNLAGNAQSTLANSPTESFLSGSFFDSAGGFVASGGTSAGSYTLNMDATAVGSGAFVASTDNYRVDFYQVQAVPEPTSMVALGLGAAAMLRRRRSNKA